MFKWFIFLYGQLGKHVISGGRRGRILGLFVGGTMLSFLSGKTGRGWISVISWGSIFGKCFKIKRSNLSFLKLRIISLNLVLHRMEEVKNTFHLYSFFRFEMYVILIFSCLFLSLCILSLMRLRAFWGRELSFLLLLCPIYSKIIDSC